MVDARGLPTTQDVIGFDRGYMLGYIHCLEQLYAALVDETDDGLYNFHPREIAQRISVLIDAAREDFDDNY